MKKILILSIFTLGSASVSFAGSGKANCAHAKKFEAQKRAAKEQARRIAHATKAGKQTRSKSVE